MFCSPGREMIKTLHPLLLRIFASEVIGFCVFRSRLKHCCLPCNIMSAMITGWSLQKKSTSYSFQSVISSMAFHISFDKQRKFMKKVQEVLTAYIEGKIYMRNNESINCAVLATFCKSFLCVPLTWSSNREASSLCQHHFCSVLCNQNIR